MPASIDLGMLPWEAFAAPAMLYALLLVASGLSGRRIGAGAGVAQVVTGVGLASLATVIALLVAGSVTGVGTAGRLPRTDAGPSAGIGLSPFASLQGNLQRSEPVDMLRVVRPADPAVPADDRAAAVDPGRRLVDRRPDRRAVAGLASDAR